MDGQITRPFWKSPWWLFAATLDEHLKKLIEAASESSAFDRRRLEANDIGRSILSLWEGPEAESRRLPSSLSNIRLDVCDLLELLSSPATLDTSRLSTVLGVLQKRRTTLKVLQSQYQDRSLPR